MIRARFCGTCVEAALAIQTFTAGLDADEFDASPLVQAAVERKIEVIGEALNQLAKLDGALALAHSRPGQDQSPSATS